MTSLATADAAQPAGLADWLLGTSRARPQRTLAGLVWLAWLAALAGALTIGLVDSRSATWAVAGRMGSSALLVLAGMLGIAAARGTAAQLYAVLITVGMALGLIGDLYNAELMPIGPSNPVLGAILSFGLGHVAYLSAFRGYVRRSGDWMPGAWKAVALWQLVGLVGWVIAVWLAPNDSELKLPALPYSLLLAGTAGVASGLALGQRRLIPLAVGGGLFLLSDLILAFRLFHGSFPGAGEAVWLTYGPGQMLIVYSIWAVLDRFSR